MNAVNANCLEFVRVIEKLMKRRHDERISGAHARQQWPSGNGMTERVYNRTQLRELVYSSYTAMLQGKIKEPPARSVVLHIADYLACDALECDDLLLAAGYYTRPHNHNDDERARLIEICTEIAQGNVMPSVVITRDWDLHYINAAMNGLLSAFGGDPKTAKYPRNLMDLLIHPAAPGHRLALAAGHEAFLTSMRMAITTFKRDNAMCEQEPWYLERLARWRALTTPVNPAFDEMWDEVRRDKRAHSNSGGSSAEWYVMRLATPDGRILRLRPLTTMLPTFSFPRVITFFQVSI